MEGKGRIEEVLRRKGDGGVIEREKEGNGASAAWLNFEKESKLIEA